MRKKIWIKEWRSSSWILHKNLQRLFGQHCLNAAMEAYEETRISGLCAEGRWECAVQAIKGLDLEKVIQEISMPSPWKNWAHHSMVIYSIGLTRLSCCKVIKPVWLSVSNCKYIIFVSFMVCQPAPPPLDHPREPLNKSLKRLAVLKRRSKCSYTLCKLRFSRLFALPWSA